jgi:ABC-2 type transport system permease protein
MAWNLAATLFGGLYFPLRFLPAPLLVALWVGTPFPSVMQGPADIVVERVSPPGQLAILAGQAAWVVVMFWLCRTVQRVAERRLVVQGG